MPILLFVAWAAIMLAWPALAHDSWISRGGHRNAAGEWCCGTGDCFAIPTKDKAAPGEIYILPDGAWYYIVDPNDHYGIIESIPASEAQPSPDGEYWRCKRPNGTRRCFFAPPPST